ncbi:MAG: amidophosphoribosyltransferase [Coriobacteriales bacterium]|jgi:amidophosphoribosyltransferase|nr:amidophosphoribosyltransferase [Coriobacteriales bacterium]
MLDRPATDDSLGLASGACSARGRGPASDPAEADTLHEECAVFGVYAPEEDVARLTYFGLQALQHRGQESAGIAVADGESIVVSKDMGLVTQVFDEAKLSALSGHVAIGHTRYSTAGGADSWEAAQPHLSTVGEQIVALAHNGTLTNTAELRSRLVDAGVPFRSPADSEVAAKLIGAGTVRTNSMRAGIKKAMQLMQGAYSMVLISYQALYAFRDPYGIRPLCIGVLPNQGGYVVASETCGLDILGATYLRDVRPGEIVKIDGVHSHNLRSMQAVPARSQASCIFEYVYFARPDSILAGQSVYQAREHMGKNLAVEAPAPDADLVIGVPDSGVPSAIGFAKQAGIPYREGIVKNRYVGRTFIQPTQRLRQLGIRLKLNPLPETIRGKRLAVIDDSIVRGNTSKQLVQMLREAGAAEVHLRIVSPKIVWPCFYGIDTDIQSELIAAQKSVEQICQFVQADSLAFLSVEGMTAAVTGLHPEEVRARSAADPQHSCGYCTACFTGEYPIRISEAMQERSFCGDLEPTFWPETDESGTMPLPL